MASASVRFNLFSFKLIDLTSAEFSELKTQGFESSQMGSLFFKL